MPEDKLYTMTYRLTLAVLITGGVLAFAGSAWAVLYLLLEVTS